MLSIQRGETKQKPMKISYNSEENRRPEKRILSNKKRLASNWKRVWAGAGWGGIILLTTALLNCVPRINSHLSWRLY